MGVEHVSVAFSIVTNRTRPGHHFTHSLATLSALGLSPGIVWLLGAIRMLIFHHQGISVIEASALYVGCEPDGCWHFAL